MVTVNSSLDCPLHLTQVILFHVITVISILGFMVNILNMSVFFSLIKGTTGKGHIFKYFLLKSMDDAVQFLTLTFAPVYFIPSQSSHHTRMGVLWYIWFYRYVKSVFELSSSIMQCAATIDCYVMIKNYPNCWRNDLAAYLVGILTHIFGFVFYR